jgi:outer membrane receptor protein involved in Fe transport
MQTKPKPQLKLKNFLFFLISLLASNLLHSQGTLDGKVTGAANRESLIGVTVLADDTTVAVTDADGNYSARLSAGRHRILFKMIGMTDRKENVEIKDNETTTLSITLKESARELGLIVVSAGKFEQRIEDVTVSMNVIKPSLIEAKNTTTMESIIDQSPSVNIIDGQANIRGGSGWSYGAGSRVAILVDDMPMMTADASDAKWSFLPVENIDQIEVIKGASSALYGSSALNGIINVRTAYPKDIPETKVTVHTGFYDTKQEISTNDTTYDLNWAGNIPHRISGTSLFHSRKIKNFDLVLGGNMLTDQLYVRGEFENRMRFNCNTRYRFKNVEGLSIGANFNTQFADGSLFFIWQGDTSNAYLPQSLSDYHTYRTNVDPFITYVSRKGTTLKFRGRYFRSNNKNNTNQESTGEIYYREYQFQQKIAQKVNLTLGATETYSRVRAELYNDHEANNLAFYAQADAKISKWSLSLGGRIEHNRVDTTRDKYNPVLRTGLNYNLVGETYLRSSYGQGYRYPAIAEKFIHTQISGLDIFPNDSLEREKGFSAEIGVMQGLKIGGWKGYFDAAVFYTEYDDMIEFTFSQWAPLYIDFTTTPWTVHRNIGFKAINIGDTKIQGLDLSLSGEGTIGPFSISVLAGYTYVEPTVIQYDSAYIKAQHVLDSDTTKYGAYLGSDSTNYLKYRFSHIAKADVSIGYKKFTLGVGMRYNSFMKNIDKIFVVNLGGARVTPGVDHYRQYHRKGDQIYDGRISYQFTSMFKFSFIVNNVFNHIYMGRPSDMQAPRVFIFQASFTL